MSVDTQTRPADEAGAEASQPADARSGLPSWAKYLTVPAIVAAGFLALWFYLNSRELGGIEERVLSAGNIRRAVIQHLDISLWATVLVLGLAIPIGIALTRPWARRVSPVVVAVANIGQGVPSIGTFVLVFILVTRGGRNAAILGLAIYSFLPVLRGTMLGLQQVPKGIVKAARGMGMGRWRVLRAIELPLSVPIMLTGVRTALVLTVSTAPLAAFIGGGTLGQIIVTGFAQTRFTLVVTGSVLAAGFALLADWVGGVAEDFLRPRGL